MLKAPSAAAAPDPDKAISRRRALIRAAHAIRTRLRLPPKLTLSEWADEHRVLSPEAAAQPGQWRTDRVPYLREIMDTVSGREHQDITIVKCSQSGGSEVILNAIGFYVDQEPCSILAIQPNVKPMGEAFSKSRIAPMIRDCPRLKGKMKDPRARDSGNTIMQKTFPGGTLFIMGANSPAGLASNPIRVVLADELDRWPASAGTEGDPLALADARQITYRHRRKKVKVSSPGNEGESRIEKEWKVSDQRHYYVPCPHCGHEQPLEWRDSSGKPDIRPAKGTYRVVWEKEEVGDDVVHKPETAVYVCRSCACTIDETHKPAMLAAGRWVKHNPASRRAGFHISGLLSPWVRWSELGAKWLAVKDEPEQMKTFFNTLLGLLYVGPGEEMDPTKLADRRVALPEKAEVPATAGVLTAAIDAHDDRLEMQVMAWGEREQVWIIRLERFHGDPDLPDVWARARAVLDKEWQHEGGAPLLIRSCMIDSGHKQDAVFAFVKSMPGRQVFASKGADNAKQPLSRASRANRDGVKVFTINPNAFKDVLFSRLKRKIPGPGYIQFGTEAQTGVDDAYFLQFGAEKRQVEFVNNRPVVSYKQVKKRNEAIDLYVLGLAALRALGAIVSQRLADEVERVNEEGAELRKQATAAAETPSAPSPDPADADERGELGGWMRGYSLDG